MSFLEIRDLAIDFAGEGRVNHAVRGVDLDVDKGETVALVGESGSGKSVTALSALQLLPYPQASHPRGSIRIDGNELIGATGAMLRDMLGDQARVLGPQGSQFIAIGHQTRTLRGDRPCHRRRHSRSFG